MLVHKNLASGQLKAQGSSTLSNYQLYDCQALSGVAIKSVIMHNVSNSYVDARLYLENTGANNNRLLNLSLPEYETVEWDVGYLIHMNSGQKLYGEADSANQVNYFIYGAEDHGCNQACPD